MRRLVFLFLCTTVWLLANAQTPAFNWVKQAGDTATDGATDMAIDGTGNMFITGTYGSAIDINPGAGSSLLPANPLTYNSFVLKLDPSGNFIWARSFEAQSAALVLDAGGNILVTGYFQQTVDFDPGAGTFNLNSGGTLNDAFVLKLNPLGNFVWATAIGGSNYSDQGNDLCCDAANNVYVTGRTVSNAFVAKLSSAGSIVWANGLYSNSEGIAISCDPMGNVVSTGWFQFAGTDFDPGSGSFTMSPGGGGSNNLYAWKLSAAGNFIWAGQIKANAALAKDIEADNNGDVYLCGSFSGSADFDPGTAIVSLNALGSNDAFVLKLSAAGNYLWAKSMGGSSASCQMRDMTTAPNADLYITGTFSLAAVDVDPGPATIIYTPLNSDMVIAKFDALGNFNWAKQVSSAGGVQGTAIRLGINDDIYTNGFFNNKTDFDPSATSYTLTTLNNNPDIFLHKLALCKASSSLTATSSSSLVCAGSTVTLSVTGAASYTWNNVFVTPNYVTAPFQNTTYSISAITASGCLIAASITQSVSSCTGISELKNRIRPVLYPNPGHDRFVLKTNGFTGPLNYQVLNSEGRVVRAGEGWMDQDGLPLDLDCPTGLYLLRIDCDGQTTLLKLLMN